MCQVRTSSNDSRTQTKTRSRTRPRRVSACYRHPSEPVTGFCTLCLRERLAGLEPSGDPSSSTSTSTSVLASSLNNSITAGTTGRPELRRSKSVSVGKCEAASSERRWNSCDVRGKNTLSHHFNLDDESKGLNLEVKVESNNLGISRIKKKDLRGENEYGEEVRFSKDVLVPNVISDNEIEEEEEEDLKTMKEYIDLEWQSTKNKVRDFKDIGGSFKAAASVLRKKLQKWRQKQRFKKLRSQQREEIGDKGGMIARETQSEVAECGFGRRSWDTDPRFTVDANRMSMDDFDEPRASWDGYLIAGTIPRLTPMLSVVENMMSNMPEEQMHSVKENETSSGFLSAESNLDTLSSQRRSIFDRWSSIRSSYMKALGLLEVDVAKLIANYNASPAYSDVFNGSKLIITEKELKDWHLNSLKDDHSKSLDLVGKFNWQSSYRAL